MMKMVCIRLCTAMRIGVRSIVLMVLSMSLCHAILVTPGSTEGQLAVTPDGGASYSVPLKLPPGTAGLEPRLALAYNSRMGASHAGFGWSVAGTSVVQRGPRNLPEDGTVRGVYLDNEDALYLDGEKLVEIAGGAGPGTKIFKSRIENYSRIIAFDYDASGPKRLRVDTRAGLKLYFGTSDASRLRTKEGGPILSWLCDRIEDSSGNYISFSYAIDGVDSRLTEVAYTGNTKANQLPYAKVSLAYRKVEPFDIRYVLGSRAEAKYLLEKISTSFRGAPHRTYTLTHKAIDGFRRAHQLVSLEEAGSDGLSYRPLKFIYSTARGQWTKKEDIGIPTEMTPLPVTGGLRFANVEGDKRQELLYRFVSGGLEKFGTYTYVSGTAVALPSKWNAPLALSEESILLADLDGDGHTDIIADGDASFVGHQTDGWQRINNTGRGFKLRPQGGNDNRYLVMNIHKAATAVPSLIWHSGLQSIKAGAVRLNGTAWESMAGFEPPVAFPVDKSGNLNGVYAIDVDCDGKAELVYNVQLADGTSYKQVWRASATGWKKDTDPAFKLPFAAVPHAGAIRMADLNGDGFLDFAIAYRQGGAVVRGAYLASPTGWIADPRPMPPGVVFWFGDEYTEGALVADIADLTGDGLADIFWHSEILPSLPRKGAFRATPSGWEVDASLIPPEAISTSPRERKFEFSVARLGAGDVPQLVFHSSSLEPAKGLPKIYVKTANGWRVDPRVSVPVDVAQFDKADLGVRFPDLNGDGLADLAYTKKFNNGNIEKVAFVFDPAKSTPWGRDVRFIFPRPTFSEDMKDTGVSLIDFNGDGITDLLYAVQPTDQSKPPLLEAYVNCSMMKECRGANEGVESAYWKLVTDPVFQGRLAGYTPPIAFTQEGRGALGVRTLDLNGDGLTDLIVSRDEVDPKDPAKLIATKRYFKNEIDINTRIGRWTEVTDQGVLAPVPFVRPLRPEALEIVGPLSTVHDNQVQMVDLDGDRLPDLLFSFLQPVAKEETDDERRAREASRTPPQFEFKLVSGAFLRRGATWMRADYYAPPHRLDQDESLAYEQAKSVPQTYFQDVNGDGLVDLIYVEHCEAPCEPVNATYLNTGAGWTHEPAYVIPALAVLKNTKGDQGFRMMDVNADGLVDIIYHRIAAGGAIEKGAQINTGFGWKASVEGDGFIPPIPLLEAGRGDLGIRPLDLNGDGIVDFVQTYKRGPAEQIGQAWLNLPFADQQARPFKTDLLVEVENGLGLKTTVNYRSLIGTDVRGANELGAPYYSASGREPAYPMLDPPVPGYVVSSLTIAGPGVPARSTRYRYGEYKVNTLSGKSLGFGMHEIDDIERGRTTSMRYFQEDGLIGNLAESSTIQAIGSKWVTLVRMKSRYSTKRTEGVALPNGFRPTIIQVHLEETQTEKRDLENVLTAGQTDTFTYDAWGNPLTVNTLYADGSGTQVRNTYGDDLVRWHLGRLLTATVTHLAPGKPSETRMATFAYHSETGQLMRESSLSGTQYEVRVDYARDLYGNKTDVTVTPVQGPSRRSKVVYDTLGRYAITSINAIGHRSEAVFDEISGVVLVRKDPNQLRQTLRYDSLQRLISTVDAANVVTNKSYKFADGAGAAYQIVTQTVGLPPTVTTHDASGRIRHQSAIGFGGRRIVEEFEFNRLGQLVRTIPLRFEGAQPQVIQRRYDKLDRIVEEHYPDGSRTKTRFSGLNTYVIDQLGRETLIEKDLRGRVVRTRDSLKGETQFRYDVSGKAVETINALGHVSRSIYNLAGQRERLDDPTLGTWNYRYDGFAQLVQQVDGRGESVQLKYDAVGRLVERKSASDSALYTFDGENGIGLLKQVVSSNGASRSFAYDRAGRMAKMEFKVGQDTSIVEQTYDELSRPLERRYSSGFKTRNQYDEQGFWRSVSKVDEVGTLPIWQADAIDALGRVRVERLGNGVVNSHQFDEGTGRLQDSSSKSAAGTLLLSFSLEYDTAGNIVKRTDRATARSETFSYDALNRITQAQGGDSETVSVTYDALGNILNKTGTGEYQYCDTGRTRVLCGLKSSAGTSSEFRYDLGGNMIGMGDKALSFDGEGRVTSISQGGLNHANFAYGPDGEMIRQSVRHNHDKIVVTYLGDSELVRESFAPSFNPTPERTRLRHFITTPTGTAGYFEHTYWHFPFRHAASLSSFLLMDNPLRSSEKTSSLAYFLKDQLGTLRATLDERGNVTGRFEYDAWGKRRQDKSYRYHSVRQGFTGHEHLEGLGLIHMKGRVYSPSLARFVSPDPYIQFVGYSQSHNRYSYVLNNPIRYVDPSGFFLGSVGKWIGDRVRDVGNAVGGVVDAVIGKPLRWIGEQLHKAGRWLEQNWQTVAIIAAAVVLGPAAAVAFGSFWGAVATGAAIGGLSSALYGGSPSDILQGALIGAVTAAAFYGVGSFANANKLNNFNRSMLHGVAGGSMSSLRGGKFEHGFASAFAANLAIPGTESLDGGYGVAAAALAGGVTAELSGDSFENGAITASFGRLFNHLWHAEGGAIQYDGEDMLDFSFGVDAEMSPSFGVGSCAISDMSCSVDFPVGFASIEVGANGVQSVGIGPSFGFGKAQGLPFEFNLTEAKAYVPMNGGRYDVGVKARVLSIGVKAEAGVRPGNGSYRALQDLERNVINWMSRGY